MHRKNMLFIYNTQHSGWTIFLQFMDKGNILQWKISCNVVGICSIALVLWFQSKMVGRKKSMRKLISVAFLWWFYNNILMDVSSKMWLAKSVDSKKRCSINVIWYHISFTFQCSKKRLYNVPFRWYSRNNS